MSVLIKNNNLVFIKGNLLLKKKRQDIKFHVKES